MTGTMDAALSSGAAVVSAGAAADAAALAAPGAVAAAVAVSDSGAVAGAAPGGAAFALFRPCPFGRARGRSAAETTGTCPADSLCGFGALTADVGS